MNLKIILILSVIVGLSATAYISESKIYHKVNRADVPNNGSLAQSNQGTEMIKGELSGFDCAVVGVLCPTTHRGADYTTGVFTEDSTFYFIVNIPQSFLQQYFRQTVEVKGQIYNPYGHAIEPEVIHLTDGDERRLVYESGYFVDEHNRRATFQDGIFQNGKWVVKN